MKPTVETENSKELCFIPSSHLLFLAFFFFFQWRGR